MSLAHPPMASAELAPSSFWKDNRTWLVLLAPAILFLVALFFYPVGQILWLSMKDGTGAFTSENYEKLFSSPIYLQSLWITFKLSFWTTLISVIGGYPVAYLLVSSGASARQKLIILVMLPFWTSFLVRSFAWMVLLGRQGAINEALVSLGITDVPATMIYNYTGALIGMVHALLPLFILAAAPVLAKIDRNVMNAAATMGAGASQSFWRVYFPLSMPGIAAGGILVFVTALGFFITPSLLGGRGEAVITRIIIREVQEGLNWGFAAALSVMLLATTIAFFILFDRLVGLSTLSGDAQIKAKGTGRFSRSLLGLIASAGERVERLFLRLRPSRADRPRRKMSAVLIWMTAILVLCFLVLPILFVIPVSFTKQSFLSWPPQLFSSQWYLRVWESPLWLPAAIRSTIVGLGAAALATVFGVAAALALGSDNMRWRPFWLILLITPMMVPRVILAVGLFYLFAPLGLVGSSFALTLAHTALALPYVVVTVMALLKGYDYRLNHAAWTLGASRWTTFRKIQLPLIQGGIVAAFLFGFVTSFDDLTLALFVTAGLTATLPKEMWDAATMQVSPELAAVSTITLGLIVVIVLLAEWLRSRSAINRGM